MIGQQTKLDIIANNMANVNTTGFKKNLPSFEDLMYQTMRQPGATSGPDNQLPVGLQVGLGTRVVSNPKLYLQGDFQNTGNPFDMVIEGEGFFQILMPDGTIAYTRDGTFKTDSQGRITTSEGYLLEPEIAVPEGAIDFTVASDGIVTVTVPGDQEPQELGQIQLARFINPPGLKNVGRNLVI
jgi:flagellar basal-body rod protein FlgG